jgi:MFS family permease
MNKSSGLPQARAATSPATLVFLVSTAVFITYVDRGTLATAAPLMQDELHLSASQLGVLLSAFYYGYALAMAPVSWLVERYGAPRVLALGLVVWSFATLATGFASGFATILALRVLLGLGESPAFPAASKVFAHSLDISKLGLANGWLSFGYLLGPVVGTLVGGLMMAAYGWRPVFIFFGCLSLLWLLPWNRVVLPPSVAAAQPSIRPPSLRQILCQRSLWGACLGMFSANYSFYFILAWLPFYLVKARGLSIESMAWTASWAYLLNAVAALWMGWFTDRRIQAGASPTVFYKSLMALFHIAGIICMAAMVLLPTSGAIATLFVFEFIVGVASPGLFAIPQIIAGPSAAGRWVGIQNAAGALPGFVAPVVTGILVDRTGQFALAFEIAAAVNVLGLIGWLLLVQKVAPLRWAESPA